MGKERDGYRHGSRKQIAEKAAAGRRRAFLVGGITIATAGVAVYVANRIGLLPEHNDSLSPLAALYPEMAGENVRYNYSFSTNITGNRVNVYNFSNATIDPTAAETVFNFWEKTAYMGPHLRFHSGANNTIEGKATPEEAGVEHFVFIVDKDSPNPSWNPTGQPALTVRGENNHIRVNLSLIRLEPLTGDETQLFNSNQAKANSEFFTEACQTTTVVQTVVQNDGVFAQEIYCNSVSDALIAHLEGKTYQEYYDQEAKTDFTFPALGGLRLNASPISEDTFNKLTGLPTVIISN